MTLLLAIYAFFQELFAIIFALVFYLFDQTKYDPKKPPERSQKPILLVHGYLHNSSGWWLTRSRLNHAGYDLVYTVNLGTPFRSMDDYLERLQERVNCILEETGCEEVILVGHSMGGLLSSYFAAMHPGKVKHVITLAAPMEGSVVAKAAPTASGRAMISGTDFLKRVKEKVREANWVHFTHIGSTGDEMVIPNRSTMPDYTPNSRSICLPCLGHIAHIISLRTWRELLHALDGIDPKQR